MNKESYSAVIRPIENEPAAAAAALLSVTAYPQNQAQARLFRNALRAWSLREKMSSDEWRWSPQRIVPALLEMKQSAIKKAVNFGLDRLKSRSWPAAEMAASIMIQQGWNDSALRIEVKGAHGRPITGATQAAEHILSKLEQFQVIAKDRAQARSNLLNRTWSKSKPALHIALALRADILTRFSDRIESLPTLDWLDEMQVETLIEQARMIAPIVADLFHTQPIEVRFERPDPVVSTT